jgi:hypothetical protein
MVKTKCDCEKSTDLQQRFSIDSNFFIVSWKGYIKKT